ncbi:DUF309 domain-containing protein [Haloplanus sp. GCM10025708]|uniref:DUF309 domain-containing protein n=1 Tax=Haloferacaceae TaxID=1644056 RepID=UPI00361B9D37
MDASLRAGVAVYNAGRYHAAHDAWEDVWLDLESGSTDERLLHGLIQFTAAIYHARTRNWSGATGLATSARSYLAELPATYRGVDVATVRTYLGALGSDPELAERGPPPALTVDGCTVTLDGLDFEAAAVAAVVLAEESDDYDAAVLERAVGYAREELAGTGTQFVAGVMDFVADADRRGLVYRRLRAHVERRVQREDDVAGLFE